MEHLRLRRGCAVHQNSSTDNVPGLGGKLGHMHHGGDAVPETMRGWTLVRPSGDGRRVLQFSSRGARGLMGLGRFVFLRQIQCLIQNPCEAGDPDAGGTGLEKD